VNIRRSGCAEYVQIISESNDFIRKLSLSGKAAGPGGMNGSDTEGFIFHYIHLAITFYQGNILLYQSGSQVTAHLPNRWRANSSKSRKPCREPIS
jgi:hypothetical protein